MTSPFAILMSRRRHDWLGRLDPRAKLAWLVCLFGTVMALGRPPSLLLVAAVLSVVAWRGGVLRGVLGALRGLAPIVLMVGVLDVAYFGPVGGLAVALKFVLAVAVFATFLRTTPLEDLSDALVRLGVPYGFAFTLTAGARFVPTVAAEAGEILDAYRARGVPFEGSALGRARVYARVLVPLVVSTVSRSIRLAEAMEARAFGYAARRTPLRDLRLGRADWLAIGLAIALAGLLVAAERLI